MVMVSVYTPSHKPERLNEAYESLAAQTLPNWEWIVLLNNGAKWEPPTLDPRVHVYTDPTGNTNVGYLKGQACDRASGDILVELDHDDILMPTCLERLRETFDANPDAVFAYSNSVNVDTRTNTPVFWSETYGWRNRPFVWNGIPLVESVSADPDPQSISRIWFSPNHVRAWRASAYRAVGGYDPSLPISDDHDLMLRTWLAGPMIHLDEPLYVYRIHGENTWLQHQQQIQHTMFAQHDKYIQAMALKWAQQRGLRALDICSGPNPPDGFEGVDLYHGPIRANLNDDWSLFPDNSVGVIRAFDAIEHLRNPIHTMNEAYRVLAHGGYFIISVPSTRGEGAWCDPTHVSFWNSRSFRYYTEPVMRAFIEPMARCQFQALKVEDFTQFGLPYVAAHLVAIKPGGKRFYGEMLW